MTTESFKALVLEQNDDGKTIAGIRQLNLSDLPDEDVLVKVDYSSLNYKDGMAVTGTGKIVLNWPMVPGIDLAGTVVESASDAYQAGDKVVLTGWSVGEKYWGGYSQMQRVKSDWLVPLPDGLSTQQAMGIGTAGLTAMLCVMALEDGGLTPASGKIVVTGAAGGVGSVAVALLAKAGYEVTAVSGRESTHDYLRELGATEILSREEMSEKSRPLEKQRWAGAVDTVGGEMLARVLAETDYSGVVAACGLAGSFKLPTTVMPFILRNVRLQGVDSVMCPFERRTQAWQRLANELPAEMLDNIGQLVSLEQVEEKAQAIMQGQIQGRVIVDLNA
ncbi:MAG: MDR family oxidoreductase [Thiolinea sp.]